MKKFLTLTVVPILVVLCFGLHANADEPEEYVIQKGDTLWDISDSKLEDNFLWPKLWNYNSQIDDPDLIYPGAIIKIPTREELMSMPPVAPKRKPFTHKPRFRRKESRGVFIAPKKEAKLYILTKELFIKSGWIDDRDPSVGKIVFSPPGKEIVGKNNIVYLTLDEPMADQKKFFTIKDVKVVKHPVTDKKIGHQILVTGIVETSGFEDGNIKAIVISSFQDITVGDGIYPYQEMDPPLIPEKPRTPDIKGYIVASHQDNYLVSEGDVVYLDKGKTNGIQVGDVFSVFSDDTVRQVLGRIQVVSLRPRTSNAFVIEGSQEMTLGATWGQR